MDLTHLRIGTIGRIFFLWTDMFASIEAFWIGNGTKTMLAFGY